MNKVLVFDEMVHLKKKESALLPAGFWASDESLGFGWL
jgi:hypothetical protein